MNKKIIDNPTRGLIFIISGPGGTGKTTLVNMLTAEFNTVVRSISCTTRKPRPNEIEGCDYFFLEKEDFENKICQGGFLEHALVFGHYYGTSKDFVVHQQEQGKHVVLVIDIQGALALKKTLAATSIFITPPTFEELKKRLVKRKTESIEKIEERLKWGRQEIEMIPYYDYHIVNDNLKKAYEVLRSIIIAEEHRIRRYSDDR